jgi:predicted DCC family thiol-disulfide oxidoreductase YuxK
MQQVLVWFDGGCPLCRREVALMRRLDRRGAVRFLDLDGETDGQATCPMPREDMLAQLHALEDGRLLSGAAAFAAMWRAIPLLSPLGQAARAPWVLGGLERLYRLFLRVRPALQGLARRMEGRP